ncbi:MAG: hypothetical protein ABSG79_25380 [Bryobacteraceae bacterium]|jgi:hypothetical protein
MKSPLESIVRRFEAPLARRARVSTHADPHMTSRYALVVDIPKRNPALFIPVKVA